MHSMRARALFIVFAALVAFFPAVAEDVWTNNIRIDSADLSHYANIAKAVSGITDLTVYKSGAAGELWTSWLDWGPEYSGYLSDDGSVFVAVSTFYADDRNLVTVYYRNRQDSYTVKSIPVGREFLRRVNNKLLWIAEDGAIAFRYGPAGAPAAFELKLTDNRVISIRLDAR
jgi:hypothetical protein